MGKLPSKSHPTMIAIATDRWRPPEHWKANVVVLPSMADFTNFLGVAEDGASTSWSVSTTVLRTKCTNIQGFTNIGTVFLIALNLDQPSKNSLTVCYDQSSGNVSGNCSAPATFACMPE